MTNKIIATLVAEEDRLDMMPHYFGTMGMIRTENAVYDLMGKLCTAYNGGFWNFYTLSNGGFFIAPQMNGEVHLAWDGNYFEGDVSPEAAGIIACLFAYNGMIWRYHELGNDAMQERFMKLEELLKQYAAEHSEAAAIFAAID